ncbi:MAG: sigma-54-dependent Fis family transcriptional regulator [Chitinophagales bacterium]|nr:sigma-54-dependent Fis family transcriptional regulator [Chitinophagales bacterium]
MDIQTVKQRFGIIGNSPALNNALSIAVRVAPTDLTVLILGESGAGKEVFSQVIHALSARKHQNLIAVNCGAIPEGTIDSELFGHEKGSFTGAADTRKGYFEVVNGGTIFLDEVGEMPLSTQARLLRVLETGEFIRVGSSKPLRTDVRVIAATNVNLAEAVRNGKFREDLYYRLNTVPIHILALRERKEDIYLLFRKFTTDFGERHRIQPISLSEDARDLLLNYPFQGNIRELKNIAEQLSVLAIERNLNAQDLLRYLPQLNTNSRLLPAIVPTSSMGNGGSDYGFSEREILYKILFEMRQDVADLKQFMTHLSNNGITPSPNPNNMSMPSSAISKEYFDSNLNSYKTLENRTPAVVVKSQSNSNYNLHDDFSISEEVEESLSIADKERELIEKALAKHKHRRRDAALDLGISERTLYRKIKEYDIKE